MDPTAHTGKWPSGQKKSYYEVQIVWSDLTVDVLVAVTIMFCQKVCSDLEIVAYEARVSLGHNNELMFMTLKFPFSARNEVQKDLHPLESQTGCNV